MKGEKVWGKVSTPGQREALDARVRQVLRMGPATLGEVCRRSFLVTEIEPLKADVAASLRRLAGANAAHFIGGKWERKSAKPGRAKVRTLDVEATGAGVGPALEALAAVAGAGAKRAAMAKVARGGGRGSK